MPAELSSVENVDCKWTTEIVLTGKSTSECPFLLSSLLRASFLSCPPGATLLPNPSHQEAIYRKWGVQHLGEVTLEIAKSLGSVT